MQHILITGATGLIGKELTRQLLSQGYAVSHLGRQPADTVGVSTFLWDVDKGIIDEKCLDGVDAVIHLAGASVAEKRWTRERKQEIINSRVRSIGLIYELMRRVPHRVKHVISASAVGYYGDSGDRSLPEDTEPGNDFLAECCLQWEQAVDDGVHLGLRIVKLRTGIVLSKNGGALPALALPIKFGLGTALGSGKQWLPWIHITDVVAMYIFALQNESLKGAYNMAAPHPVTNKELTIAVAKHLHRPYWLPNVPEFLLKLVLGERSIIVLESSRVTVTSITGEGYIFKFASVDEALADIYG